MGGRKCRFISANFRYLTLVLLAPSIFTGGKEAFSEGGLDQLCAEVPPFLVSEESI